MSYSVLVLRPVRDEGFLGQRASASAPVPLLSRPKTHSKVHDIAGEPPHDCAPTPVFLVISANPIRFPHPWLPLTTVYARSQIELKAEDLYDKEKVDLETVQIDDVFTLLQCDDQGLTGEESARRLAIFGPNKLESEEQNAFLQVCSGCNFLPIYSK